MSEIRDEVIEDLLSIKGMTPDMLKAVLTHPNIAIVDREAELPIDVSGETKCIGQCNPTCHNIERKLTVDNILKAGWLKEVKDGPSGK